jgi:long-chain acyl-CoA synthetase
MTQAMKQARCQPLQQRWLATVRTHGDRPAVRLVAEGRVLSFAELHAAAQAAPAGGAQVMAAGNGLTFLLDVLRAWRDDAVFCPMDSGAGPLGIPPTGWPAGICHVKTTSGSTGHPRQVLFTAEQLMADAEQITNTMELRPEWPNVGVISMAHSYGFSNLVLPLLLHGIPLHLAESPLPEAMRAALAGGAGFTVPAVPAMWRAWQAAGVIDPKIKLAISAGAPLPLDLERAVHAATGVKIHNFYGSSECGGIAYDRSATPRPDARLAGTAMGGVTLAVEPAGGCLTVMSPAVGFGYAEPEPELGGGRFLTSDHVMLESGAVWLEGRASDAINVAGRKIPPSVIEEKLLALAGVRHCVVFGIPSADAARVEEIAVCLNLSGETPLVAVQQASARQLPATEQPRHWRVCQELEPDARGKISRAHWRERWPELRG